MASVGYVVAEMDLFITGLDIWNKKEYKSEEEWVGKVSRSELCKREKFYQTKKWCQHNIYV